MHHAQHLTECNSTAGGLTAHNLSVHPGLNMGGINVKKKKKRATSSYSLSRASWPLIPCYDINEGNSVAAAVWSVANEPPLL